MCSIAKVSDISKDKHKHYTLYIMTLRFAINKLCIILWILFLYKLQHTLKESVIVMVSISLLE